MNVLSLELKNFRNIENIKIEPCGSMNVICGQNAQGKTNIIEGIWLFTGAKSFRQVKDRDFVKFGQEKAENSMLFSCEGIEKNAVLEIKEKRTAYLNGKKLRSPSLLAGNFNAVVFSPTDLKIVSDGPSVRRKFLDTAIGQIYPSYIEILKNYMRAVNQRNKIIKDYKSNSYVSQMLDIFEREIAQNGKIIILYRERYIEILSRVIRSIYEGLSAGKEKISINYIKSASNEKFEEQLFMNRKQDMFSQKTSAGPHRDDLDFKINGISARSFGSQGQKRSVALALKLSEAEVTLKKTGEWPVCLLDDVMSELDPQRQNFVLNKIKGMQTFLTCCDPENVKNLEIGKQFILKEGRVI